MNRFEIAQAIHNRNLAIIGEIERLEYGHITEFLMAGVFIGDKYIGDYRATKKKSEKKLYEEALKIWSDDLYIRVYSQSGKKFKDFQISNIGSNDYSNKGQLFLDSSGDNSNHSEMNVLLGQYLSTEVIKQLKKDKRQMFSLYIKKQNDIIKSIQNAYTEEQVKELVLLLCCVFFAVPRTFLNFTTDNKTFKQLTAENLRQQFNQLEYDNYENKVRELTFRKSEDTSKYFTINEVYKYLEEYGIVSLRMTRFLNNYNSKPEPDFFIKLALALRLSEYELNMISRKFGFKLDYEKSVIEKERDLYKVLYNGHTYEVYERVNKAIQSHKQQVISFDKKGFVEIVNKTVVYVE